MSQRKIYSRKELVLLLLVAVSMVGLTILVGHVLAGPKLPEVGQSSGWVWNSYDFGNRIAMVSDSDGWMVMRGSQINSLDDHSVYLFRWDGEQWNSAGNLSHSARVFYVDIDMVSSTDGWIVAGGGATDSTIFRWNGSEWVKFSEFSDVAFRAIDMLSQNEGWAFGASSEGSSFYFWNGISWQTADQSAMVSTDGDLDMVSDSDGWAVSNGIIRWNGSAWVDISSPVERTFRSISMLNENDGWIVGGGYYESGVILRWNGTEWNEVDSPVDTGLLAIDMISSDDGWAVGLFGVILHWDGVTWLEVQHPNPTEDRPIFDVEMLSSTEGWFTGLAGGTYRLEVWPELSSNATDGSPGSYFTLTGSDYPANEEATVNINGHDLGTVTTDENGAFTLILSTAAASEGIYIVTVSVNPGAATQFVLDEDLPLRPQEGTGTEIPVPADIALTEQLFLPAISR